MRDKIVWFGLAILLAFVVVFAISANVGTVLTGEAALVDAKKEAYITSQGLLFYILLFIGVVVITLTLKYFFQRFEREERRISSSKKHIK